ncbi:hypothetical protein TNCV_3729391 [Trichonephila clavipes]|nr:hypothetical protein TNCV_3729391 [Trichonephila clavipes]
MQCAGSMLSIAGLIYCTPKVKIDSTFDCEIRLKNLGTILAKPVLKKYDYNGYRLVLIEDTDLRGNRLQ